MVLYVDEVIRRVPGYIPWSVDGDPCYDRWEGVICNLDGTIIGIDFERWYNNGPNDGFCARGNNLDGKCKYGNLIEPQRNLSNQRLCMPS